MAVDIASWALRACFYHWNKILSSWGSLDRLGICHLCFGVAGKDLDGLFATFRLLLSATGKVFFMGIGHLCGGGAGGGGGEVGALQLLPPEAGGPSKCHYCLTRSLGALQALTSSWRPFGPLNFVHSALRTLRPCDPRNDLSRVNTINWANTITRLTP